MVNNQRITNIAGRADFSEIRYAQCWEDADILLEGLDIQPGDTCLSIASAGDNTLAMLARSPERVIALDVSQAQLACLQLRVAAYQALEHGELLELMGSIPSKRRTELYRRCRPLLSTNSCWFWDVRGQEIERGIGSTGKFEKYFSLFREKIMPLVHDKKTIEALLEGGSLEERESFYREKWSNYRWQLLFRIFFSRFTMGRFGRDPSFFRYVEGSVADRILMRTRHALTKLDPAENPYLQWILTGSHGQALPFALRAENFEEIRKNLDRLEWRQEAIGDCLRGLENSVDRFNLSDIFEYMSPESSRNLLEDLVKAGRKGGRLAYWNMLAERCRPEEMKDRLLPLKELSERLHGEDKAFFYRAFVVEEIN